jgi:hypothetical protein
VAIVFPAPPTFSEPFLGRRLAQIASSPLSGAQGEIAGVAVDRLSYTAPHQNWYSTLDAVIAGRLLADAQPKSWRYLLCEGNEGVGELEVAANDQNPSAPFVAVHEGSAAKLSLEALGFAESLPQVINQSFEARFLKILPLDFTAVWLHRDGQDLIVPVTGGGALAARHVYTEAQVTQALSTRAHQAREAPGPRPASIRP